METIGRPATPFAEVDNNSPPLKTPKPNAASIPTPQTELATTPSPTASYRNGDASPEPGVSAVKVLGYSHERDSGLRFLEGEDDGVLTKRAPTLTSLVTDCIGQCERIENRLHAHRREAIEPPGSVRVTEGREPEGKKVIDPPVSSDSSTEGEDGMGNYLGHLFFGSDSNPVSPLADKLSAKTSDASSFGAIPTTTDPRVLVQADDDHSACPFDCVEEYHKDSQAIQHKKWSDTPDVSVKESGDDVLEYDSHQQEAVEQGKRDFYKISMPSRTRFMQNISTVKKSILGGIVHGDGNNSSASSDISMTSTPFDEVERDVEEQTEFGFESEASNGGDRLGLEEYSTFNRRNLSRITSLKQQKQLKLQRQLKSFINGDKETSTEPSPGYPTSPSRFPMDVRATRIVSGIFSAGRVAVESRFSTPASTAAAGVVTMSPPRPQTTSTMVVDSMGNPVLSSSSSLPPTTTVIAGAIGDSWGSVSSNIGAAVGQVKPTIQTSTGESGLPHGSVTLTSIKTPTTTMSSSMPSPAGFDPPAGSDRALSYENKQVNQEETKKSSSSSGMRNCCKNFLTILIVVILVAAVIVFFTMFARSKKEEPYTEVVVTTDNAQDPFTPDIGVGGTGDNMIGGGGSSSSGGGGIGGMADIDNPFFNGDDGSDGFAGGPNPPVGDDMSGMLFNDRCIYASKVLDWQVSGTNVGASWDGTLDKCGEIASPGPGVWFYLEPTQSRLLTASAACDSGSIRTQITIFTGTCDALECVAFHGGANTNCGATVNRPFGGPNSNEAAVWFAGEGVPYFILVEGYRGAEGKFSLQLDPVESQDSCPSTTQGLLQRGSSVSATTRQATIEDEWVIDLSCNNNMDISSTPGVWFRTGGSVQSNLRADVIPYDSSQFQGQITVFSSIDGTCGLTRCEEFSNGGSVTWSARQDRTYYILVNARPGFDAGDFEFKFNSEDAFELALNNDVCNSAARLITSNVPLFVGSTENAEFSDNVPSCGTEVFATSPGLWFTILGTGGILSASTCGAQTQLDTQISVFRGDGCWDLRCVVGNDDDPSCAVGGSTAKWFSEDGVVYYIFVSGRGSSTGLFELTVRETFMDHGNECESAPVMASNSDVPIVSTTVEFQPNDADIPMVERGSYRTCGIPAQAQGVWYEFKGTGRTMVASTCHEATNFGAMVSVFWKGCDDRRCVDSVGYSCGGQNQQSMVSWQSKEGESYHVFVHGSYMVDTGEFDLTIGEPPANEVCGSAMGPLLVDGPAVFGSTYYASIRYDLGSCNSVENKNDSATSSSRGVWYYFDAVRSETVTASACSVHTNFDAELYVFAGDCNSRECVQTSSGEITDSCGPQSAVSWSAEAGVRYLVLLRGSGVSEFGNYALSIQS